MKKIFKRVSAAVIALAVVMTSTVFDVPWEISAAADGTHTSHKVCIGTACADCSHEEITDWTPISDANGFSSLTDGGRYYLTAPVTLTDEVTIANNITLCLNGQTINAASGKRIFSIGGGSLTLCDCKGGGKLTGGNPTDSLTHGGAVMVYPGTFTMYGGTITGNTAEQNSGGGVYVSSGTFTMHGGTISGNTANSDGGGVLVDSSSTSNFIMNGGTISDNNAKNGGGVYLWGGKFTMNDGTISGNTATTDGGGVYFYSSNPFTMNGGTISGNAASGNGGGVCGFSYDPSAFIMNGGTISDNTASGNGGGVRYFKTMTLNGNVTITGNKSGTDDAQKDDNVYLPTNKTLTIGADFSTDSTIGITTYKVPTCQAPVDITTTDNVSADTVNSFKADKEGQQIVFADGKLQFKGSHTYDATTGVCSACGNAGKCGDNATWAYDEATNTLTVSGTGAMTDWTDTTSIPWADKAADIQKVVIEDGINSIGDNAFNNCSNLADVTIPDSVTTISPSAFMSCTSLTSITIPRNVTTIGDNAFDSCTNLKTVTFERTTPPTIGSNVFNECSSDLTINVPEGTKDAYKDALTGLTDKVTDGTPDNECGDNATWAYDETTKTLTISGTGDMTDWASRSDVPWNANVSNIENVVIENGITSIGNYAFYLCSRLTSITIPSTVTSIGEEAFYVCASLTSITIPEGVTSIRVGAFRSCRNLTSVTLPNGIQTIQAEAFYGCGKLGEVMYPSGATVGSHAIPDTATKVEYTVSNGKLNVTEITLGTDKESFTVTDAMNIGFVAEDHRSKVSQEGHTHLGGTATCAQKAKCVICDADYGSTLEHKWGEWKITTSPTTTNEGTAERTCKDCTGKETKTLPKIAFTEDGVGIDGTGWTVEYTAPTLTGKGSYTYTNEEDTSLVIEVGLPALNDTTTEGVTDKVWTKAEVGTGADQSKNPTPTEGGTFVYTSTDYGTIEVEVPALSDDAWAKTETTKPTISSGSEYTYTSTDYGTVTVDVPKLSDTDFWTKKTTGNTEPGADTAGSYTYTSDYGEVTVNVPKLSDTTVWTKDNTKHVDPTEETEGKDVYISEYGEVTVTLQKLNHTHTLTRVPEVPATETSAGTKEHWHCADCGKNFADENGTKEVTADDLKIGTIETEVQAPVNVEIATPQETLIAAALTADEQQEIEKGTDIKIILKVENAAENVPAEDKGKVETEINGLSGYKLGQYLDVTLLKKIGEGQEQKITETSAPIRITFEIPSALRGKAAYSVIRVHNGTATVLPDLDSVSNTVTIETDKFSTYALTYQEKATPSNPSGGNPGGRPSGGSSGSSRPSTSTPTESDTSDATSSGSDTSNGNENSSGDNNSSDSNSSGATSSGNGTSSGNANPSSGDNSSDSNSSGAISSGNGTSSGNANSSSGDNNSDSNSSGAASSGNGTSSGNANSSSGDNNSDSNSSNTTSSESSPSEGDDNPSTGIAVSLIPCTAALAAMVITTKRRRK